MKDIKTFAIGFLTCACLMLIMGIKGSSFKEQTDQNNTQVGRYQLVAGKFSHTKIVIAKQRNGPTGHVQLVFRRDVGRFEQVSAVPNVQEPVPIA